MRRPCATMKSSSHSPQLDKAQVQHQRPSIAKKEKETTMTIKRKKKKNKKNGPNGDKSPPDINRSCYKH